jgi:hypothetical protein
MQLRVPETITPGSQVKCPKCNVTFAVPAPAPAPAASPGQFTAAPPSAPAAHPGFTGAPGFGGSPGTAPDAPFGFGADEPRDPLRRKAGVEGLSTDYTLDINAVFAKANAQFGAVLGPMIGFIFAIIVIAIPLGLISGLASLVPILGDLIGVVISAATFTPLSAGFIIVSLAQFRGKPWTFGDFFGGFQFWGPLFIVGLINGLISFVCLLPSEIATLAAGAHPASIIYELMNSNNPGTIRPPNQTLAQLGQLLQYLGLAVYFVIEVRFLLLANYFIVDRGCSGIEAIKASMSFVTGHFWGWLGLSLLYGIIAGAGVILCCVGLLFTIPYSFLLMTATYLVAIGERPPMQNLPF